MTAWRVRGVRLPDGDEVEAGVSENGTWTCAPASGAAPLPGRFVLPGLVDAHCHLSLGEGEHGWPVPLDVTAARTKLAALHDAGVTAVRDTGGPGSVTLQLLADTGGTLQVCGRFLAPEYQYFPELHSPVPASDLVEAALREVAAGARWVKLVGDFPMLGPGDTRSPAAPTYAEADIRQLVEAVHAAGARVAVHTTTRRVSELISAGIDSVEHGTGLEEDDIAKLAAAGGAWTPTLCATFGTEPKSARDESADVRERWERLGHLLRVANEQDVTIMTGSDVVGTVAREVALLTELGLAPEAALAAATTSARRFLGIPDLSEGEPADLVSYEHDPRDDPAVLGHPAAVFVRGRRVR